MQLLFLSLVLMRCQPLRRALCAKRKGCQLRIQSGLIRSVITFDIKHVIARGN
ncbi:hypothetical protein GTW12_17740 [Vibrio cholerae]|nr:hypothetical protein [Vibrio cholerae]